MTRSMILLGAGLILTACGGGGGDVAIEGEPGDVFAAYQADYDDMDAFLRGRSNTAFIAPLIEGMPDSGTARFDGYMSVGLDTGPDRTELLGQTTITADFGASTMQGDVTNFVGTDNVGFPRAYDGQVDLTNGDIAVTRPNDYTLDYAGSLDGGTGIIDLSGTLTGSFKADPIRGIVGDDAAPKATIDGAAVTGSVAIAAEIE